MDPVDIIKSYASFPSVSTDSAYKEGMDGAREYVSDLLTKIGFEVEVVDTEMHPIILAERGDDDSWPHLVIYGHYDVQPAEPFDLWTTPPFAPEVRNGRIYARGAADNKGPVAVQIVALARIFEKEPNFPLRLTYLIEGEEETGSPSIPEFLNKYGERLKKADFIVLSDTGIPDTTQLVITTGLRGLCIAEIEVEGPCVDLHSGIHGGALLNPIQALTEICASLHDEDGCVNISGFYDDVVEPKQWERDELSKMPVSEKKYKEFLGIPEFYTPKGYSPFEAIRFAPTLEFNGIGGGYQAEGNKTVIPSKAFAKITCRLVPNQSPEKVFNLVRDAVMERCPAGVTVCVKGGEGGVPYRVVPPDRSDTPEDQNPVFAKAFKIAEESITTAFGKRPLYLREGGSVPIIGIMKEKTGLDSLMIGLFTPEDNLHAPNESFDIELANKAVNAYELFFRGLAK